MNERGVAHTAATEARSFGIAWLDLAAGRFSVMQLNGEEALEAELERLREALITCAGRMGQ